MKNKSSQAQRDRVNARNDRLRAKGMCISCGKRPASGKGATGGRCPICSEVHRVRARNRYRQMKGLPEDMPLYGKEPDNK